MEKLIAEFTKMIHPQDLGAETTRLEDILRLLIIKVEILNKEEELKSLKELL